ncbi:ASCH domain-containing protein [Streptomyces sp. NBC_00687]|uniref:ASCH domain-containing protein n=1 Tax=Streptomyces sp. NBC_00687 TaxID=2975807 RepID=UPI00224D018C|nr:ASCH domain-containing protein [Streptomyces sp. NBC_00687]MCX4920100.1 ASCH domain-containing protein [Streptomyces sp. NBC_00687]
MNTPERAVLLSLHPRFATAILSGEKTVELRRQRVAVPPGTPVIIYATSPVMALTGTARLTDVDTAPPTQIWRRHRTNCGITRAEYTAYMDGASQASALLLDSARPLSTTVPLDYLRAASAFHPPQSYRYLTPQVLQQLVAGHDAAAELLDHLPTPSSAARTPRTTPLQTSPTPPLEARLGDAPPAAAVRQAGVDFTATVALTVVVGTALGCF